MIGDRTAAHPLFRENSWLATAIANAVWLLGDAVGYIRQMIVHDNHAEYDAGIFLAFELLMPCVIGVWFRRCDQLQEMSDDESLVFKFPEKVVGTWQQVGHGITSTAGRQHCRGCSKATTKGRQPNIRQLYFRASQNIVCRRADHWMQRENYR